MDMCKRIIERGFRPSIITNLAKNYSDEEVDLLSQFYEVQVSLDSDDTDLMRKVRKAVRVDNIFETLTRIREAARRGKRRMPKFTFSVGIYDPSIWTLESFVDRIIRQGSFGITFWDLVEYRHQGIVKSLDRLDPEQKTRAREVLVRVARKLDIAGVPYDFAGDFHAMVPKPTVLDYVRKGLGFAYSYSTRYLFSLPSRIAFARRP
jgi:MoaA/NifB/PqqE/SkfB family radical SAM enzyme